MDPLSEMYQSISPYDYVGGNPIRRKDIEGKNWWDKVKGEVAAVVDNTTGLDLRGSMTYSDPDDYNTGQNIGDVASAAAGAVIVDAGLTTGSAGAVVTVGSGGTAAPVSVPVAAAGYAAAGGGAVLATRAATNLANQKGRVNSEGSVNGNSESKVHGNSKESTKPSGNYTNYHESGKTYSGVGEVLPIC